MDAPLPATTLLCTQCGGELHPDEGQIFLTCPYCGSTVYLDKERVVFHWVLAPTLDEQKAGASLARWMAGNQTVKDLDKKARVTTTTYFFGRDPFLGVMIRFTDEDLKSLLLIGGAALVGGASK